MECGVGLTSASAFGVAAAVAAAAAVVAATQQIHAAGLALPAGSGVARRVRKATRRTAAEQTGSGSAAAAGARTWRARVGELNSRPNVAKQEKDSESTASVEGEGCRRTIQSRVWMVVNMLAKTVDGCLGHRSARVGLTLKSIWLNCHVIY